jgi:putative SOS response-associated peptidase YedK
VHSFCIVTCPPNEMMAKIHDRMPVILDRGDYERWLGEDPNPADLLKPFPGDRMKMWRIDRKVGNVKNDMASILDEVPPEDLFE